MKNEKSKRRDKSFVSKEILRDAAIASFTKLKPKHQIKNFVMFIVLLSALITSVYTALDITAGRAFGFNLQISLWLWFTVIFANFAESIAEGKGKAQAESLKKAKRDIMARRLKNVSADIDLTKAKKAAIENAPANKLKKGDVVICTTGDVIPSDGEIINGVASVDESAITGESAPVIREAGGDRSAVTGGTKVLSDEIIIRITADAGNTFIDKLINLVEGASRKKTPNEVALSILLAILTIIFILVVVNLKGFMFYSETQSGINANTSTATLPVLIALLVCLIPTTIGGLLSAIGISGMERLISHNVIAMSGRAVEAAGDIDVLLLDKTGTITLGNRMASDFIPLTGIDNERLIKASYFSSLSDETPEGRSIVKLAKRLMRGNPPELRDYHINHTPFSASTRTSGVEIVGSGTTTVIKKGATDAIEKYILSSGRQFPVQAKEITADIAKQGATPLVVAENGIALGVIALRDIVKQGIKERFNGLRKMGIRTIMITGDNPLTAASIATEAGVDDYIAEATPETKLERIRLEQTAGHLVAMIGDGTNDAPAIAQADVGVAMNTGTQAAKEAGNMIDLDSNPTKLIEIVEIGKQLLITRGALTTFSIANDVSKFFAILPALFVGLYVQNNVSPLAILNIMRLGSPESAILSAVIFNALIIIALIPLALKGVKYRAKGAKAILVENVLIYGVGGLIVPFIGIKLVDVVVNYLNLA
ncbi:potassium-transporting ATPase subunit B [Candidatus Magnetoovum chiemensis]|nr:potassium-transporting ATPase subunit B [Candidatus Magnetoovum chiemensis]